MSKCDVTCLLVGDAAVRVDPGLRPVKCEGAGGRVQAGVLSRWTRSDARRQQEAAGRRDKKALRRQGQTTVAHPHRSGEFTTARGA